MSDERENTHDAPFALTQMSTIPRWSGQSSLAAPAGSAALDWWPQCPWPEAVWINDVDEIGKMLRKKIGDQNTTAAAGVLMRHGWKIASKEIMDSLIERGLVPPNAKLTP